MEKLTYTVSEAAKVLGVSPSTMYKWVHIKGFPAYQPEGKILISRKGLEIWFNRQIEKRMAELDELDAIAAKL